MAGATKFVGFDFTQPRIYLERWGKRIFVELPADAITRLKDACVSGLPASPPPERWGDWFEAKYDDAQQEIRLTLAPGAAELLFQHLDSSVTPWGPQTELRALADELKRCLSEHKMMREPKSEPGLGG